MSMNDLVIRKTSEVFFIALSICVLGFLIGYTVGWVDGEKETVANNQYINEQIVWKKATLYHCKESGVCYGYDQNN